MLNTPTVSWQLQSQQFFIIPRHPNTSLRKYDWTPENIPKTPQEIMTGCISVVWNLCMFYLWELAVPVEFWSPAGLADSCDGIPRSTFVRGRKLKRVPKSGESLTNGVYYQVSWEATFSSCLGIIYNPYFGGWCTTLIFHGFRVGLFINTTVV